jgi:hypothetical protein
LQDKEVVAVRLNALLSSLKVYISKNSPWCTDDNECISKIKKYLKSISIKAPTQSDDDEEALINETKIYC